MAKDIERLVQQGRTQSSESALGGEADLCHVLHGLVVGSHGDPEALYADCLSAGRRVLGLSAGLLGRIEGDNYTVLAVLPESSALAVGQRLSLADLYCERVAAERRTQAVVHVSHHPTFRHLLFHKTSGFEAYLGTPIWVDDAIYGVLSFFGPQPRSDGFSQRQVEFVELVAWGLGRVLERRELERRCTRAMQKMQENIDLFESAFEYAPIGKALVAPSGRILRANRAFAKMLGYAEEELSAMNFQAITHSGDLEADVTLLQETLEGKRDGYQLEKRYLHRDGTVVWALLSVSLVRRENGRARYFVSQVQDITEQKQVLDELYRKRCELELTNQELQSLVTKDPLTQLLNRRGFFERFHEELNKCARSKLPLSLLMLDVDHFKSYNDTFGHPAGDVALQKIADVLRNSGRAHDVVARHGGEEFAVILPGTDVAGCEQTAERIRLAVTAIDGDDIKRPLTSSIGCATTEAETVGWDAADQLLKAADEALYAAKAAGRNQVRHGSTRRAAK